MQSSIVVNDVSFEFSDGRILFQNFNFSLGQERTALVGPNGIGKSYLAKLISGEIETSKGKISRNSTISYLPQREKPERITVEEFLQNYSWSLHGEKLLTGIDRNLFCDQLSGGQWMRVRLAERLEDQFLILDEPTNDLDQDAKKVLIRFLKEYEYGFLLISHDRECLKLCDTILELSNQGLNKYGGGWNSYGETKERERKNSLAALEKARRERDIARAERIEQIDKQEKRNRKGEKSAAKGGTPKILLGARKRNAQTTSGKINSSGIEKANEKIREVYDAMDRIKIDPIMYADLSGKEIPSQKLVAEAKNFNIRFQDWIYENNLNFSWKGNIRIAIKGANGSGKSTLLQALLGSNFESTGSITLGKLNTLYIDQRCNQLDDSKSIFENVRDVSTLEESEIRNGLAKFLFFKDTVFQKVHTLSGGERLRAALARGLLSTEKAELLLLDEPTNNLDLGNIEFLEGLISEFKAAVIIVSHDETFLENCGIREELAIKHILNVTN
ncbi:ABC transporter ATP-binding protein [Leptospira selangorensis]|uniref:ABC transporter ATP-binding protein n=1 Tax=Leptospira selangorensis TaxID=2484982 RepID=A0A5F2C0J1_9LEPT|nr:ATP-binding cassette domain-containing protein [Leptospira selangorensis]TGM12302.1 ABC transporter ATP-binding protein [Leptospira selangorensis]TGM14655.1 ABC transporter ATP-binding protein [Leptospira selangorensis]